jgi:hypothetical protein
MDKIVQCIRGFFESKAIKRLVYFSFFWIIASATFNGTIAKYGLMDGCRKFGIEKIVDESAHRPFVYRQLLPQIAKMAERNVDAIITCKAEVLADEIASSYAKTKLSDKDPSYKFIWLAVYGLAFLSLFFGLILIHKILLEFSIDYHVSLLAVAIFSLSIPYLQTPYVGFYYDYSELFFISAVILLALRKRLTYLVFLPLTAIATLNKETFTFFIPTLYPFIRQNNSPRKTLATLGAAALLSCCINVVLKVNYSTNPGGSAELHLFGNIRHYLSPEYYFKFFWTYGTPSPRGANILVIIVLGYLLFKSWRHLDSKIKMHAKIATAITLPLFFVLCETGELRNLSFLYITLAFLIAIALKPPSGSESATP